jgi:transposase
MAYLVKNIVKGNEYWKIVESKREGDKVRQVVIDYIGNTQKLGQRLLAGSAPASLKSYSLGDVTALMDMAARLSVAETIDNVLGARVRDGIGRGTSLVLAAVRTAIDPGSKRSFSLWFEGTTLPQTLDIDPKTMTSQHFWEQMDGIDEEELREVEDAITKTVLELYPASFERLALDYTNYFTYIATSNTHAPLAQRGKNKQKRNDLRQLSLAVVTSKELHLPLFSHVYPGNINDRSEFADYLPMLMERMGDVDTDAITLVFDGGSNTKENLKGLPVHYLASFSLSCCKELYDVDIDKYEEYHLPSGKSVKAYRTSWSIWGERRECVLELSKRLLAGQVRGLDEDIKRALDAVAELNERLRKPRSRIKKDVASLEERIAPLLSKGHLREIITVDISPGCVSFEVDEVRRQEVIQKYFGKKLLVTDRSDWTTVEIMDAYREQDSIEKIFRDSKDSDHFSLTPMYHWTDQKIRVHVFICLLSLTLATLVHREVCSHGLDISKDRMLDELGKIRQAWVAYPTSPGKKTKTGMTVKKVIEDMNPLQRELWDIVSAM